MSSDSDGGGLSREEFLLVQEQLLQLRNKNYELQEDLRKKNLELQQLHNSPKNEALQFASKLINRASNKKDDSKDVEIEALRRKLATQEEEFRLQQSTLFQEMNSLSAHNDQLKKQNQAYDDHPLEKELGAISEKENEDKKQISSLEAELEAIKTENAEILKKAENSEKLTADLEDMMIEYRNKIERFEQEVESLQNTLVNEIAQVEKTRQELENEKKERENNLIQLSKANDEITQFQLQSIDLMEKSAFLENQLEEKQREWELHKNSYKERDEENKAQQKAIVALNKEVGERKESEKNLLKELSDLKQKFEIYITEVKSAEHLKNAEFQQLEQKLREKDEKIAEMEKASENERLKHVEDRALLLETRYQLEIDDLTKNFEAEKEQLNLKITSLDDKVKSQEEEKKLALKKQSAMLKELQKSLKQERKRADSYEKKIEEKSGWHVVPELDENSTHTFDGNESISSLSAVESENVELITRLATLQKIHSENTDRILQLESENSRLRREVLEKGELIENWIREKPMGNGFNNGQNGMMMMGGSNSPRSEAGSGFRRLLNTLGQDQNAIDLKEMNKKLQRMLEETLSKNIILQRDIQTLIERTE